MQNFVRFWKLGLSGYCLPLFPELLQFQWPAHLAVFQRRNIHRYTWYSNDEQTAKEIDHVLVNIHWNVV